MRWEVQACYNERHVKNAGQRPKGGNDAQAPIYDFKVSKRVGYKTVRVPASRVVIVEGIYALSARIRYVSSQASDS